MNLHHNNPASGSKVLKNPNLHIIFCTTLAAVMGVSSITPALPLIGSTFSLTISEVAWLITIFTLPGILLTPALGIVADLIGRKRILVPSMLLFGIAGFACSFAQTFEQLLLFRFIQGVGVAAVGALNVTLIGDIFKGNERARAMGYNSGILSFGATFYPVIGGALAAIAWYYPFYLPLLSIPVALLIQYKLVNPEPEKPATKTQYFQLLKSNLSNKKILLLFGATLASFLVLYGPILTMLPFLIHISFTESSMLIGFILGCVAVGNGISAFLMGRLAARFSEQSLLKFSFILYVICLAVIPFMHVIWALCLVILVFGLAQGLNLPVIITLISVETQMESRAAIMSLNGMVLRIAQTVGPIIITSIFAMGGFITVYLISALFTLLIGIIVFLQLK